MMPMPAFCACMRWSQRTTCVSASMIYEGSSCGPMTNILCILCILCTAPFTPFTVSCRQCKPMCIYIYIVYVCVCGGGGNVCVYTHTRTRARALRARTHTVENGADGALEEEGRDALRMIQKDEDHPLHRQVVNEGLELGEEEVCPERRQAARKEERKLCDSPWYKFSKVSALVYLQNKGTKKL
jgi:hypothetical protein